MAKRMNSNEHGIFSFGENLRSIRDAHKKIVELNEKRGTEGEGTRNGHTKKIDYRIERLQSESRRSFLRILAGGAVIAGGGALASKIGLSLWGEEAKPMPLVQAPKSQPIAPKFLEEAEKVSIKGVTRIDPVVYKGDQEFLQMIELQNYWKQISINAFDLFKDANPKIPGLAEFMKKNAFYSIPSGPVMTQHIFLKGQESPMNNPNGFEVVFMPEKYASRLPAPIVVEPGGRTMRIATSFRSLEWLGIMLAHEMSHVHDGIVGKEGVGNKDEWLGNEVKAHLMEMDLLKHWSPQTYDHLMENGVPLFRQKKYPELQQLILALYPLSPSEVSRQEFSLGIASCLVAIAFTEAMQRGSSERDLQKVYQDMTKNPAFF